MSVENRGSIEEPFAPGMTVAIGGGPNTDRPALLVRRLLRSGVSNLAIVAFSVGLDIDLLVGLGRVSRIIVPCLGRSFTGAGNPFIRRAIEEETLEVIGLDDDLFYASLKAAALGLTFFPVVGEPVTALEEHPHLFSPVECPFTGRKYWAIGAMKIDYALIHLACPDYPGGLLERMPTRKDSLFVAAAKQVLFQMDEDSTGEALAEGSHGETRITAAPFAAHPFLSSQQYFLDADLFESYYEVAKGALKGDRRAWEEFCQKVFIAPETHTAYLSQWTTKHLAALTRGERFLF